MNFSFLRLRGAASAFAVLVTLAVSAPAYVGKWQVFTDMNRVTALAEHKNAVYVGTLGGIRRITPSNLAQHEFTNLDGLLDPWITGVSTDPAGGMWAVARSGYVYELDRSGRRWTAHGGSYVTQQWVMNERAVLSAGTNIFLGSQKGLAMFDTRLKVSELTLTRFGSDLDIPVLSLLRRGDTLFVGTSAGVYKARVYFPDPLNPPAGYDNPADHNKWIKVNFPPDSTRQFNHLAIVDDTLATFGPGTLIQPAASGGIEVRAFAGLPIVIGSQGYGAPWTDYTSALISGGKVFIGGASGLAVSGNPTGATADAVVIPPSKTYPRDTIANIGAYGDVVYGHAQSGVKVIDQGSGQVTPVTTLVTVNPPGVQEELYYRYLRNVVVTPTADVYIGSWGGGLVRRRANGQNEAWKNTFAQPTSCLATAFPGDGFTVVHSLARPYNKTGPGYTLSGLFFTNMTGGDSYQVAYFDTVAGIPVCPASGLNMIGGIPHAIHLFSDTLLGVATETGVTLMKVREEGSGPRFEASFNWSLPGSSTAQAWDLATDGSNRPWALIGDRLAFLDTLSQLDSLNPAMPRRFTPIDNFIGSNCKSLESDPAGKLWVGCLNGLFHVETTPLGEIASVRRYTMSDGLPSLFIYDVTVDHSNGKVWVATDRGVALFQSASQPKIQSGNLALVIPYPNPFRPHHRAVIFNKLPENSTLRIYGPTGQIVRIFHPRELTGNEAQWDGRNESGKPVPPGVYVFSVTSGGTVQRGKVIVAR